MADTHVISALVKKRAELRGDIIHYKQLIATLDKDLQTIDATIKIFDVDYDISSLLYSMLVFILIGFMFVMIQRNLLLSDMASEKEQQNYIKSLEERIINLENKYR